MVTINDIAKALGVAKSTVSNALTGNRYVNPELKDKILKKCEEMEFQPNFFASTLSNKKLTNIVGLFLELSEAKVYQSFYNQLLQACIKEASEFDYHVLVYYGMSAEKTETLLNVGKAPIDCAILLSPELMDKRAEKIEKNHIPTVYIGKPNRKNNHFNFVDVDNYGLVLSIINKLVLLEHQYIVMMNSRKDLTISKERFEAYFNAKKQFKLPIDETYHYNANQSNEIEGYQMTQKLISENKPFTAIITANDLIAKGVYDCLKEHHIEVGKDISVITLGGDVYINSLKPLLSYVYQDYEEIGKIATQIVLKQIEDEHFETTKHICKSKVHYRSSIQKNIKAE
jgi:DNA-binding LacI/PurR family transcriptional regulator